MTGPPGRARRRARLGRPDLDPDLLAARLPDRFGSAPARARASRRSASSARRYASTRTRSAPSTDGWPMPATSSSRHGAGTHVADRPPQRRGTEALAGIVSEMLRRAAHAGFTADEVAAATFAAATERKRPGPLVHVLFAECTSADAGYDAERLVDAFPGHDRGRGRAARRPARAARPLPLRPRRDHDVPRRRGAGPRRRAGAGRRDARRAGVRRDGPRDRRPAARARASGSSARRSVARRTSPRRSPSPATEGVEIVSALIGGDEELELVDRTADIILLSREALGERPGRARFSRPERIRPWTYEFDPVRASSCCAARSRTPPRPATPDVVDARRGRAGLRPPGSRRRVPCFGDASVPRPATAPASGIGIEGSLTGARRPGRDRRRRASARLAARMNAARPAGARADRRRARSRPSGSSTRSATC